MHFVYMWIGLDFYVWLPKCINNFQHTSHYGPAKKASPVKAGSHNLHYHINNLSTEKMPA